MPDKDDYVYLEKFRKKVHKAILEEYPSIEKFCFENDLPKSTVCRFLRGEGGYGYEVRTLIRIAYSLNKWVEIDLKG